jgi:hypothetical protein
VGHCFFITSYYGYRSFLSLFAFNFGKGLGGDYQDLLKLGHHYLDITQVREDVPNMKRWYRHQSTGAWPFSTRDHGWPISDCTSEALKAALMMRQYRY